MHTPGPWFVGAWTGQCHLDHRHDGGSCKYDYTLMAGDEYWRRHVSAGDAAKPLQIVGVDDYGPSLSEADARLIAAAPDMLRELKSILEWAVYEHSPLMPAEIASIKATIAKAEGRS
jgi:hypothetical protein